MSGPVDLIAALDELVPLVATATQRAGYGLPDLALPEVLSRAQRLIAMLTSLSAVVVGEMSGRGIPAQLGYRSAKSWLRDAGLMSAYHARQLARLAATADQQPSVGAALAAGAVTADQADAIGDVLADLRSRVDPTIVAAAEQRLLACAGSLGPEQLSVAGSRVVAHVAPEIADEQDARALERAEQRARIDRQLTLSPDRPNHRVRISGWLTPEMAATVTTALAPLAVKRPRLDGVEIDDRSAAQRRADALEELCRTALAGDGAQRAGVPPDRAQLAVTVDFDLLAGQLGSGVLDSGFAITPESVRRLACDARILPVVMNGAGQVLDLGRAQRTWSGPARNAVIVRDCGCVFPGCDRPPSACEVHHIEFWSCGGRTDLANGALLCAFHHYLIHHSDWQLAMSVAGVPEVIPPVWIDPVRTPRRNDYHQSVRRRRP